MNRILEPLALWGLAILMITGAVLFGNQKVNDYIDDQTEQGRQVELLTGS